jgi:hypothetical protein
LLAGLLAGFGIAALRRGRCKSDDQGRSQDGSGTKTQYAGRSSEFGRLELSCQSKQA